MILNGQGQANRSCKETGKTQGNLFWCVPLTGEPAHVLVSPDSTSSINACAATAHVPYPGRPELCGGRPRTSLQRLLSIEYFPAAKRLLHIFTSFSNLINAVLGWGSSSHFQTPSARNILNSLQTTLKSSFCSFYRLLFLQAALCFSSPTSDMLLL